jgi:hypothetical protein
MDQFSLVQNSQSFVGNMVSSWVNHQIIIPKGMAWLSPQIKH